MLNDFPTGIVPAMWINGVPVSLGQPYVALPDGRVIILIWK